MSSRKAYHTPDAVVRALECRKCLTTATEVCFLTKINPGYGEGALAVAKKVASGELRLDIVGLDDVG